MTKYEHKLLSFHCDNALVSHIRRCTFIEVINISNMSKTKKPESIDSFNLLF